MAKSGAGKFLTGCSCLSVVFFMVVALVISFGLGPLAQQFPDLAGVWAFLGGMGGLIADGCCCLSGVGLIIGIVLLLLGGRNKDQD